MYSFTSSLEGVGFPDGFIRQPPNEESGHSRGLEFDVLSCSFFSFSKCIYIYICIVYRMVTTFAIPLRGILLWGSFEGKQAHLNKNKMVCLTGHIPGLRRSAFGGCKSSHPPRSEGKSCIFFLHRTLFIFFVFQTCCFFLLCLFGFVMLSFFRSVSLVCFKFFPAWWNLKPQ